MAKAKKFGAFSGVFTPSILTLLGVIMYLRLPWIVGQAGLLATLGIILVAHIISGSTGLSVSSIATDKRVESGGTYYIISRSLGLPIGGTLGWALFVGLSFSVSLYLIGFAEVFLDYFGFEVTLTTIRIAGSAILLLVTILTFISTSLAIKTQYIILTIMILSLLSVFLGKHEFTPVASQLYSTTTALPWIALFAIFFPAVTGFEAGVSMSGDLQDARKDIPLGTISAILVGLLVYVGLAVFLSYTVKSDLLVNDTNVLLKVSWIPQLVVAGILGATLSSALGSILGAPRIMQAVAKDRIAPAILSKGYGPSNEPRNALMLTFVIAEAGILVGELNVIARIVTIFFIITYGFLNITYAAESWASSDFRPSFKIPRIVSIIGALACIIVMIELDILALAVASVILLAIFFYLKNKELTLQTGDTRSSLWLSLVKNGLIKLAATKTNSRNWRPNMILFSGGTSNRPHLVEIGKALIGKLGIFTNFELVEHPDESPLFDKTAKVQIENFGDHKNIITRRHVCRNIYEGIGMISKVYGFSGYEPNTILMGWAKNTREPKKFEELLITLRKLDYNLTFLNYNEEFGYGKHKKIDFWWSGKGRNLPLALHFIRFMTVTHEWRDAEVRILAISTESKNTDRYHAILHQIIDNYRINASVKVINNIEKLSEKDIIRSESGETDLTIAEIPYLTESKAEGVINYVNNLTEVLRSCLFISAASVFEPVNVISETSSSDKAKTLRSTDEKPDTAITNKLQFSTTEIVYNEVYNLAQMIEKYTETLINNTFYAIQKSRNEYLDQLASLTDKMMANLIKATKVENKYEKHWEYLKILNDFSYHAQKELAIFKDVYLKEERELVLNGFNRYFSETNTALYSLPDHIRLTFSKDDYRKIKPVSLFNRLNKAVKIRWVSLSGKKITTKNNVQPVAGYYLYYKRLKFFKQFYENYTVQTLAAFAGIRELLVRNHETILTAQSGNLSGEALLSEKESNSALILKLRAANQELVYNQSHKLLKELISDIGDFSKIIESPQANKLGQRFKPFSKKTVQLEVSLSEFPDLWLHFMVNHVNKTYLDFLYLALKNRIASKIEKTNQDIEILIEGNIHNKLKAFKDQIISIMKTGNPKSEKKGFFTQKSISAPQFEVAFSLLSKEIKIAVDQLPENIEITGDNLQENIKFENLENIAEFVVSVRKTADYYISNELSSQIQKQFRHIGQQLSFFLTTLKNLIKLANFHLENRGNHHAQEVESLPEQEKQNAVLQNLLNNVQSEERKLDALFEQLRQGLDNGLKNAFEPLSSAVIVKNSGDLKRKIKATEKRKFKVRIQELKDSVNNSVSNQFVKLLYRRSKGLLWANRLEQLREKALLFPGGPVKRMLEKISPNKAVIQKLPFYYSNLFSGSSTIGIDFWVGMEDEIEKGSKAIKRFLGGSPGLLIISGERSSGKSSLSKHLANLHFEKQNIFNVKAPRESIADVALFEQTLLKNLEGQDNLVYAMEALPPKSVIVINDLELWWERKPFGMQVVEKIIALMRQYGDKVFFIINVNQYALKIINQLSSINTWALDIVFCQPFDARELKDLILMRHKSGGMNLIMNKKREEDMTDWDFARLFSRFFNLSAGNPGYAINLWLAGIRKISGNTLYMESPFKREIAFPEDLPQVEIMYILQFILHRRFSVRSLSEILQSDIENTGKTVRVLVQKGILLEKFPDIYSINPALEIHLVKKLKSLELL